MLDVTILLLDEVAPGAGAPNAKSPVATTTTIRVHTNTSEADWTPRLCCSVDRLMTLVRSRKIVAGLISNRRIILKFSFGWPRGNPYSTIHGGSLRLRRGHFTHPLAVDGKPVPKRISLLSLTHLR